MIIAVKKILVFFLIFCFQIGNAKVGDVYYCIEKYSRGIDNFADDRRFLIKNSESIVLRGITNTEEVSAKTGASSGTVYFRSAYFSNLNQF